MSQDTRKDPRAKVLTMTVRYKSATLDEFIEHHSYDVSRGGMFIKTPSPFPPGTLLKFEVKIAADQKVIQGVGRVVWKRDSESGSGDTRPAGMGVKFIKIDDASRKVIDALVESRGDATSAYEAGGGDGGALPAVAAPAPAAAAPASVAKPAASAAKPAVAEGVRSPSPRKATMIGLGAINPSSARSSTSTSTPGMPAVSQKPASSFFPDTRAEADMPPPEDRTVMKQAAELLQDALRETGSSIDEVSASPKPADPSAKQAEPPPSTQRSEPPPESKLAPRSEPKPASAKPASVKPAAVKPASARPAGAAQKSERPLARRSAVSEAPASRRVSVPVEPPEEKSGGGRVVVIAIAIAAAAAIVFLLTRNNAPPPPPPVADTASAEPAPPPAPAASEAPTVAETASAAPAESAAPSASPAASAAAAPTASTVAPVVPKAVVAPTVVLPKPPAVVQPKPAAKPKPAAEPSQPSAEKPSAPTQPTAEKPAAPAQPTAEKPAAPAPKPEAPAAKPKPAEPAGDNPY